MKKLTVLLLSAVLALSFCACAPDKSGIVGKGNNKSGDGYVMTDEELTAVLPEIKSALGFSSNGDDLAVYGKYNGYFVVEYNGHSYHVISTETIGDVVFTFSGKPQTIYGYFDGELYELKDLYADEKITHDDLVDIHGKHCDRGEYIVHSDGAI